MGVINRIDMLNITSDFSAQIADLQNAGSNVWLTTADNNVTGVFTSRTQARDAKTGKPSKYDGEGFNLQQTMEQFDEATKPVTNGSLEINPIEALQAVGLNPIVIDENTDFSKLPTLNLGGAGTPVELGPREEDTDFEDTEGQAYEADMNAEMKPPAGWVPAKGPSEADFPKKDDHLETVGAMNQQEADTDGIEEDTKPFVAATAAKILGGDVPPWAKVAEPAPVTDVEEKPKNPDTFENAFKTDTPMPVATVTPVNPVADTAAPVLPADVPAVAGVRNKSVPEKPTKLVWHIADEMKLNKPDVTRKEILAECDARGIAYYTARTQYQLWKAIQK